MHTVDSDSREKGSPARPTLEVKIRKKRIHIISHTSTRDGQPVSQPIFQAAEPESSLGSFLSSYWKGERELLTHLLITEKLHTHKSRVSRNGKAYSDPHYSRAPIDPTIYDTSQGCRPVGPYSSEFKHLFTSFSFLPGKFVTAPPGRERRKIFLLVHSMPMDRTRLQKVFLSARTRPILVEENFSPTLSRVFQRAHARSRRKILVKARAAETDRKIQSRSTFPPTTASLTGSFAPHPRFVYMIGTDRFSEWEYNIEKRQTTDNEKRQNSFSSSSRDEHTIPFITVWVRACGCVWNFSTVHFSTSGKRLRKKCSPIIQPSQPNFYVNFL